MLRKYLKPFSQCIYNCFPSVPLETWELHTFLLLPNQRESLCCSDFCCTNLDILSFHPNRKDFLLMTNNYKNIVFITVANTCQKILEPSYLIVDSIIVSTKNIRRITFLLPGWQKKTTLWTRGYRKFYTVQYNKILNSKLSDKMRKICDILIK